MAKPLFDFSHLTIAERIQLAQDLWDSVAEAPELLELTEAQRAELDRRLAAYRANPDDTVPWDALREELNRRR
jgi:putative addiction module component (TIGR02574 family)